MPLTQNGYVKRSATEIKADIVAKLQQRVPDFTEQDADLQNDLLDTSIEPILQYEDLMNALFNAYSPGYSNDDMFRKFAESLGLRQRAEFKAQVTLTFSGKYGDFIPANTIVTDENGTVEFKTQENVVCDTTGTADVLALSETEDIWNSGELKVIKTIIGDGISVINKSDSLKYIPSETEAELKARAQAKLRSVRQGGKMYAEGLLAGVEGVDRRLIAFYDKTIVSEFEQNTYYSKGIECVIGGGSDAQVAKALYLSFLETQKLISQPSNKEESTRKRSVFLYIYNNPVQIDFTRPKLLEVGIQMNIAFTSAVSTPVALQALTQKAVTEYINSLKVGMQVNKYSLIEIIIPILVDAGMPSRIMKKIDFKYKIGKTGSYTFFNSDGFIKEIEFDCYCILLEYGVEING